MPRLRKLWIHGLIAHTAKHAKVNEDTLVTVDVAYAGVNYADVCIRWGLYSSAKKYNGYPITPGFEFSGTVQSVGSSVTQFKKGDNVFGVTMFGAYSTRVTVPECQLFKPTSTSPFTQRESVACCMLHQTRIKCAFASSDSSTPPK